jgi:hypothetical protein
MILREAALDKKVSGEYREAVEKIFNPETSSSSAESSTAQPQKKNRT